MSAVMFTCTVVIVEAKSHRLTPQGLRGAPDRLKRHIKDLVLEPSMQSSRLESVIAAARDGDAEAQRIVATLGIDATQADLVIRLSVTLDDLSVLSSSESDLKKVGWVPDHQLPQQPPREPDASLGDGSQGMALRRERARGQARGHRHEPRAVGQAVRARSLGLSQGRVDSAPDAPGAQHRRAASTPLGIAYRSMTIRSQEADS